MWVRLGSSLNSFVDQIWAILGQVSLGGGYKGREGVAGAVPSQSPASELDEASCILLSKQQPRLGFEPLTSSLMEMSPTFSNIDGIKGLG